MTPTPNALLIAALFLSRLEEMVLCQSGHCTEGECFALIQEPQDFPGAVKSCENTGGQLLVFDDGQQSVAKIMDGLSGSYWLTAQKAAAEKNCSFISVSRGPGLKLLSKPCSEKLDGFVCHYLIQEPCSGLEAGGGAKVKYTAYVGFEMINSETFPQGTSAVAKRAGAKYPESKHLCFLRAWQPAPWNCDVLRGGCEYRCNSTTNTCVCPAGQILHHNNISCITDPCANCTHECQKVGDTYVCKCPKGYRLAQDGGSCVDASACETDPRCTGENKECVNIRGKFQCRCKGGLVEEDGVCVDDSICLKCEHMICDKVSGVYECGCRKGFRVSAKDPTKCELNCTERDCPANCIPSPEKEKKGMFQCYCPEGYIQDLKNNTPFCTDINECDIERQCQHKCENLFGGYRCSCDEGFKLHKEYMCLPIKKKDGSGSDPPHPTAASVHPAAVPPYIKTGSVLGISVFMVLCVALLCFLARNAAKRCGKFNLSSFKHADIDIFYLQQVTTDTYKRLSFDKPIKNDTQRL